MYLPSNKRKNEKQKSGKKQQKIEKHRQLGLKKSFSGETETREPACRLNRRQVLWPAVDRGCPVAP